MSEIKTLSFAIPRWLGDNNLPFDVPMTTATAWVMLGFAVGCLLLFLAWVAMRGKR